MSLFFYDSLESHHGGGGLMGLVVVYGGPTLDKYYCVVTIGDNDLCRWHIIPHFRQLGAKKQYYSVIFSITAVTCNLAIGRGRLIAIPCWCPFYSRVVGYR